MSAREAYRHYEQTSWPGSTTGRPFGSRLAVGLAFAIAITLGALCALAWVNNEDVVAWSLSRGLVSEASAESLYGGLRYAYLATAAAGLIFASLALGTVRRAISAVGSHLRAVTASILHYLECSTSAVARAGLLVLGYAGRGGQALAGYVRSSIAALVNATGTAVGYAWTCVLVSLAYAWAAVSRPLRHVWLGVAAVAAAAAMTVLVLWVGGTVVARQAALLLIYLWTRAAGVFLSIRSTIAGLLRSVWTNASAALGDLRLAVAAVFAYAWIMAMKYVGKAVSGALRHAWLGAPTIVGYFWMAATIARRVAFTLKWARSGAVAAVCPIRNQIVDLARVIGAGRRLAWLSITAVAGAVGLVLRYVWLGVRTAVRYLWLSTYSILSLLWRQASLVAAGAGLLLRYIRLAVSTAIGYLGLVAFSGVRAFSSVMLYVLSPGASAFTYMWVGLSAVTIHLWRGTSVIAVAVGASLHYIRVGVASLFGMLWLGLSSLSPILGLVQAVVRLWSYTVLGYMRLGVATTLGIMAAVARYAWWPISTLLSYVRTGTILLAHGIGTVLRGIGFGASALGSHLGLGLSTIGDAAGTAFHPLRLVASAIHNHLRLGVATAFLVVGWTLRYVWQCALIALGGVGRVPLLSVRTAWIGLFAVPDIWGATVWKSRRRKGVSAMSDSNLTRERLLSLVVTVLVFFTIGSVSLRFLWPSPPEPTVTVVHWTTGHLTRDGLLKDMAKEFNEAAHRMGSGMKIVVEVYDAPSELQGKYLSELLRLGTRRDLHKETNGYVVKNIPDPTIVTPSSAHWLVTVNHEVGRPVVDLDAAESIVRPVMGIVTYEEMARCMGWPEKEIGFADIIALRNDPAGWQSYDCAKAEWGQTPLLAFTDPTTSSTGRSLHLALYSFAAHKSPENLTIDDVNDPEVVAYVKEFQGLIDHYLIGTTVLNTKIYQGPRYGHFFVMPEDNLIHLYEGTEKSYLNGIKTTAPPINERMVMIYPKEGSMPRNNCACIVQADWVSEEQVEASQ